MTSSRNLAQWVSTIPVKESFTHVLNTCLIQIWIHVPDERMDKAGNKTKSLLECTIEKKSMVNLIHAFSVAVKVCPQYGLPSTPKKLTSRSSARSAWRARHLLRRSLSSGCFPPTLRHASSGDADRLGYASTMGGFGDRVYFCRFCSVPHY